MRNKVIALFLISALVVALLVAPSFAFGSWGSETSWTDLVSYADTVNTIEAYIEDTGYEYMFIADRGVGHGYSDETIVLVSSAPLMNVQAGGFGLCSRDSDVVFRYYTLASDGSITSFANVSSYYRETNWTPSGHLYWYLDSTNKWWLQSGGFGYASYTFYQAANTSQFNLVEYAANLTGLPWQDNRVLNAYNAWFDGLDYIQVEVSDDVFANYAFVTVHGYDSEYETPFYYTFRFDDFLQKGFEDGLSWFKLNPRLIPWEHFYLDSLEYVSSGDFGTKSVSLPDLDYGYEPLDPDPLVNEYHYNSTTEIHYQYGSSSRYIYSMFSSKLRLNTHDPNQLYFCDDQLRCSQRFNYSTIFLPYCLTDLNIDFEEFFNECVNYYDLVVVDVDSSCFDLLYGSGSYAYLENYLYTNPSKELADWYSNHYSSALHLGYYSAFVFDPSWWTVSCNCAFYFTTSWFFKQTNYLLGDTGDILTELSSRLFEVDGFADKLFGNMSAWASDQTDFYNTLLPKLMPIVSFCNDMTLGDYFNKIVDRLDTIVNNLDIPIDLPIDDDVAAMANAFVEFWTKMFQGASPYATAFASTLQSLVSSDPQVFSLPEDPNNIALPVFPSPSVPLLPTLTPTPVPIGG